MIRWPDKYSPDRTRVHVHNQLEMPVPSTFVWAWLIRAELWPTWYENSKRVVIEGGGPDLRSGSRFQWTTFGVRLDSKVEEFASGERLAWSARATGIDAYHAWLIENRPPGSYVVTEETQNGWLARLSNMLRPRSMSEQHQNWLEGLRRKAAEGPPPAT
ncbi:MAG TPA: SRPBCC family protein [Candidatus Dormibacteraeota bacterium]|nr:SRPBCC family protein [Candidatus Dormibacteraeota bacterium]